MKNKNTLLSVLVLFNDYYHNESNGSNLYHRWDCIMANWLTAKMVAVNIAEYTMSSYNHTRSVSVQLWDDG